MAGHTVLGYILAVGLRGAGSGEQLGPALLALVIWVVFLNGGTLAINSVFDKDEGDIGYLNAPPPLPRYLLPFSVALLVAGQLLAFLLPAGFQIAYAICFVLSILYSVPPFRFKAVAGVDWVINMWGFGSLTPYAAWAATGRPLDVGHDRKGPDTTVALEYEPIRERLPTRLLCAVENCQRAVCERHATNTLGFHASGPWKYGPLDAIQNAGANLIFLNFVLFGWAARLLAIGAKGGILAFPLTVWLAVLLPWLFTHARWTPAEHQRGMYRALAAWAVTDLAVLSVFAWY